MSIVAFKYMGICFDNTLPWGPDNTEAWKWTRAGDDFKNWTYESRKNKMGIILLLKAHKELSKQHGHKFAVKNP